MLWTMPLTGALIVVSIFIASKTINFWPSLTRSPSAAATVMTIPGMLAATWFVLVVSGFDRRFGFRFQRLVDHRDFSRLTVEFKENGARSVGMWLANGQEFDNQSFSLFDINGDLFSRMEPVEEVWRGKRCDIAIHVTVSREIGKYFGVQKLGDRVPVVFRFAGQFGRRRSCTPPHRPLASIHQAESSVAIDRQG